MKYSAFTILVQTLALGSVSAAPAAEAAVEEGLHDRAATDVYVPVTLLKTEPAYSPVYLDRPNIPILRIEGATSTIYEAPIPSNGHNITTAWGGTHHCDGTNLGANPSPSDTCTSAMDAASKFAGFTYDGTYDIQFDDYFITRIGSSAQTATQFWDLLLNYQFTPVGGCQQQVKTGDQIFWAFDAFNKNYFLKLQASTLVAKTNQKVALTVTDGSTGFPIANADSTGASGASIAVTDTTGKSTVSFSKPGIYSVKAERSDSIRSNSAVIVVA